MRRVLFALVLASCLALGATAAPASAAPAPTGPATYIFCSPLPGQWLCQPVPPLQLTCPCLPPMCPCPPPPPCDCWSEVVDYTLIDAQSPPLRNTFYTQLNAAIVNLGAAAVATDPQVAAQDRAIALNEVLTVGRLVGRGSTGAAGIGTGTPTVGILSNGMFLPTPGVPWRQQAGNDITAGIQAAAANQMGPALQDLTAANALYAQNG
jgi:hypothetical protein